MGVAEQVEPLEYGDGAVAAVGRIRALLDAGLSTDDIASVLPCASGAEPELHPCPDLLARLRARLEDIRAVRAVATTSRSSCGLGRPVATTRAGHAGDLQPGVFPGDTLP